MATVQQPVGGARRRRLRADSADRPSTALGDASADHPLAS